jgi:hypothetical protein
LDALQGEEAVKLSEAVLVSLSWILPSFWPTRTQQYGFFVISHGRRNILHFNVEAFPEDGAPQYLVLDQDGRFKGEVATMLEYLGSELIRTAYRSPWQNDVGGALGGKLSAGTFGPRDPLERIPSPSAASRLPRVLPRRPHS